MISIDQLFTHLGYEIFSEGNAQNSITAGYTSDLLSDVMGNADEGSVLITIQAHKNTIAVASLIGMPAIILCNGRTPTENMIEAAKEEGIAILGTKESQFTASYKVAKLLGLA